MRKAAVRDGDPTTTGGRVMGSSTGYADHGKKLALDGDVATCGNCKGAHLILGTGKGISDKGRNVVVDDDSVFCPCGKNRVIVGSNPGYFLDSDHGSASASSVTAVASPSQAVDEAKHTRWCFVWDRMTGEPLANRDFVADVGGVRQCGKTDGQGYAKIETNGEQPFNIHVIFSSPKRVLKPRQGN
ncbi:MAG TPA: PAAR domain-containing protein [Paraburkholderia sp.]|nr:PAAR domain-containing protein [Paraburkholderia sp.]